MSRADCEIGRSIHIDIWEVDGRILARRPTELAIGKAVELKAESAYCAHNNHQDKAVQSERCCKLRGQRAEMTVMELSSLDRELDCNLLDKTSERQASTL